jgi:hypothetical protein
VRGRAYRTCGMEEIYTKICLENLKERDHLEDLGVDEDILDCS